MKKIALVIFYCISFFYLAITQCSHPDFDALMEFYNSTGGPEWTDNTGWAEGAAGTDCDPCNWFGVICEAMQRVHTIDLRENNLAGTIPDLDLPFLRKLWCSDNQLIGSIPNFSNLPLLETFWCNRNQLTGTIPDFSNISNLTTFLCSINQITGSIPNFSNLPLLETFWCTGNELTGTIPNFSTTPLMKDFQCAGNQITGSIPNFSNLPLLETFWCFANQITGSIPNFSNLPNLIELEVHNNNLTGAIPNFSNLISLYQLRCEQNQLSGSIPDFTNLPNFDFFWCNSNELTGCYPDYVCNLSNFRATNNPFLPWYGDHDPFCMGEDQIGAICDDGDSMSPDEIQSDCSCLETSIMCDVVITEFLQFDCVDNGTPLDPIDDYFTVRINATNPGPGPNNLFEVEVLDNFWASPYGTPIIIGDANNPPFNADGVTTYIINVRDFNDQNCNEVLMTTPVMNCSATCALNAPVFTSICNDNNTPSNPDDDTYTYTVELTGNNTSSSYSISGDDIQIGLTYNIENGPFGPFLISGGDLSLNFTDDIDQDCSIQGIVEAPAICSNDCTHPDFHAMIEVYNSLIGENWYNKDGWEEGGLGINCNPCEWYGVECDNFNRVTNLDLSGNNCFGTLPQINLPFLESINVVDNHIGGSIPDFVYLTNIKEIRGQINNFTGPIPNFSNLPNLEIIDLQANELTGPIPDFSNLPELKELYFRHNMLTGPIPDFPNLPKLWYLALGNNSLEDNIPDFSNLPELEILGLGGNKLTGPIPDFSNLPKLRALGLGENELEGPIPDFSNLPELEILGLGRNKLTGPIPDFSNLTNLERLVLSENELDGFIPDFTNVNKLWDLWLSTNFLTGPIPDFSNLPNLNRFFCDNNDLEGCYPDYICSLDTFYSINNLLLPWKGDHTNFCEAENQIGVICDDNNPESVIDEIQEDCGCEGLVLCDRERDSLALVALYNSTDGPNWINTWNLNQPIDTWYGLTVNMEGCVECLDLDGVSDCDYDNPPGNNLVGTIPDEIGDLLSLKYLYLEENQLTDSIPNSIGNLQLLEYLDLSDNDLSGVIPLSMGNLDSLRWVAFDDNQITGPIPDTLGSLENLYFFIAPRNNLSGCYPDFICSLDTFEVLYNPLLPWEGDHEPFCMGEDQEGASCNDGNDSTLNDMISSNCVCTGCDRQSDSLELVRFYNATDGPNWTDPWILSQPLETWKGVGLSENYCVDSIYLYNRNLSGILIDINLPSLKFLNIRNNQLTGSIPDFDLPNLIYFDCRSNQLSGSIPDFNLPSLDIFRCSYNQLTGSIPDFTNTPLLRSFECSYNQLDGSIPDFSNLPNLETIECRDNQLISISNFTNLPSLKTFYGGNNEFTGAVPDFINSLNLYSISLYNNKFSSIPDFGNLPSLRDFSCSNNQITGTVPDFQNVPQLQTLDLGNNQLDGSIPDFTNLPLLSSINLSFNNLNGYVPDFSDNLQNLGWLYIHDNSLTFEDMIENLESNETLVASNDTTQVYYNPQDSVFKDTVYFRNVGDNLSIDLVFDDTVSTSTYHWYKDGVSFSMIQGDNKLIFNNIQLSDSGTYRVEITNPLASDLTLYSYPIEVIVEGCAQVNAGNDNNVVVCQSSNTNINLTELIGVHDDGGEWIDINFSGVTLDDPNNVDVSSLTEGIYIYSHLISAGFPCSSDTANVIVTIEEVELTLPSISYCPNAEIDTILDAFVLNAESYLWSSGETTSNIFVSEPGVYIATVTIDEQYCQLQLIDSAFISVYEEPDLNLVLNYSSLCNDTIGIISQINAEAGISAFNWSNGHSFPNLLVTDPGLYSMTITDNCGLSAVDSIQINPEDFYEQGTIEGLLVNSENCLNGAQQISAEVSGDIFSIIWNTGETGQNIFGLPGQTYSITVTDICLDSTTSMITVDPGSNIADILINTECRGDTLVLKVSGEQSFLNTVWTLPDMTTLSFNRIEVLEEGTYIVDVIDECGNFGNDQIEIVFPDAGENNSITICELDAGIVDFISLLNGSPDSEGNWVDVLGSGLDLSDPSNVDISILDPGFYQYDYVISGVNTCIDVQSRLTLIIEGVLNPGNSNSGRICNQGSTIVNLNSLLGIHDPGGIWEDLDGAGVDLTNSLSVDFGGIEPGIYNFEYRFSATANCPEISQTIQIEVLQVPNAGVGSSLELCVGEGEIIDLFTLLSGNPDLDGFWTDVNSSGVDLSNPISVDFSTLSPNTYNFRYTVPGVSPCVNQQSTIQVLIVENPIIDLDNQYEICPNIGDTLYAGGDPDTWLYEWKDENNNLVGSISQLSINDPGSYSVVVTDENGCSAEHFFMVEEELNINAADDNFELIERDEEICVLFNDQYVSSYTIDIVASPQKGTVAYLGDGCFTYTSGQQVSFSDEFTYRLCSIDCPGNCDEAIVRFRIRSDNELYDDVLHVITPNDDGYNDQFDTGIDDLAIEHPNNEIFIFNRWGHKVFEANPYNNDWKGQNMSGKLLPQGTYYYVLRLKDKKGSEFAGSITIIRE